MPRFSLRVGKPDEEASPHATIRRSNACSGAHNRVIAARLASHCALPDSMILASSSGLFERGSRKLVALKQVREPDPLNKQMLGAGQREKTNITFAEIELPRSEDRMPPVL